MRVDRRFVIVVGLSLVWALVVSLVFYRAAAGAGKKRPWQAEKPVVVAVEVLPLGAVIRPDSVKLARVPEKLFPRGGFSRIEEVLDRPVISPIQPEEPVVEARLALRGSGGGVAPLIPPGMRAISVRVNDVVGVAGFVLPGMRVDVLVTGRPPGRDDTVTTTVLQNIAVLSAGKTIQVEANSQSISTPVVTLLVTPQQAEALTLANTEGRIQLVLRNSVDQELATTPGRDLRELYSLDREGAPRPSARPRPEAAPAPARPAKPVVTAPAQPLAPPQPERVLMIRGNQKSEEAVDVPVSGGRDEAARSGDFSRQDGPQ
jgi:pilus assembly protein CpaB